MTEGATRPAEQDTAGAGPCAVCGGRTAVPYATTKGYDFVRCNGCGFVFLSPMPTQAELNELYSGDDGITADHYPKAKSRRGRAFWAAVRFLPYLRGRRALDIGCGGGFMVDAMRRMGARAAGVDISPGAIAYARKQFPKNRFWCESFETFDADGEQFDFIYSSEVIEHLNDLPTYMALLRKVAAPGARLFLTTPDIGSPRRPENVTDWDVFSPPRHVQFFDETTLARLFSGHGFGEAKRIPDKKVGLKMLFRRVPD